MVAMGWNGGRLVCVVKDGVWLYDLDSMDLDIEGDSMDSRGNEGKWMNLGQVLLSD